MKKYWILGKGWIGLALAGALILGATFALAGPGSGHTQFGPGGPGPVGSTEGNSERAGKDHDKGQRGGPDGEKRGGRDGEKRGGRGGEMRGRVLFGTISSESGGSWTIKPELPPKMKEHAEEKGRELPKLPDAVKFTIGKDTKFYFNSAEGSQGDFKAGDQVVVKLDKPWKEDGASAEAVADPETAREYIMKKMGERGGRGGGPGGPRGEGGPGGHRRPGFGTVSAVSADSITITPEVPDFIAAKAKEMGRELPMPEDLPKSVTIKLDTETKYVTANGKNEANPFKVGDKVAVLSRGGKDDATAIVVSDYATAEARMKEAMERGPGGGPEGREGKGRKGGKGARGGGDGQGCRCGDDCDCRDKDGQ